MQGCMHSNACWLNVHAPRCWQNRVYDLVLKVARAAASLILQPNSSGAAQRLRPSAHKGGCQNHGSFWIPIFIRHLIFRVPIILTTTQTLHILGAELLYLRCTALGKGGQHGLSKMQGGVFVVELMESCI